MRIVIDLQGAQTESRFRGIGRYTLSLAQAIVRNRGEHEVILALSNLFPETIEPIRAAFDGLLQQDNIRVWYAPGPVRECEPGNTWRREVAELIREAFLASLKPDIVHITSLFEGYVDDAVTSIGRFDQTTPVSVSLYDLIPLLNPEHYLKPNPAYEQYYHRKLGHLRRASTLFAISEFSRQEGLAHLGLGKDDVVNISTAANASFCPISISQDQAHLLQKRFGIERPFVLYTGGTDDRKNLPRLINAYASLSSALRENHQLVFAGKISESEVSRFRAEAKSADLHADELLFTGYVSDDELVQLYNLCKLFIFPSWHEGFGLPALEAMACGAVVIGANTSSVPEVVGRADALFDPHDVTDISFKLAQSLEDERFRADLAAHALKQAKQFSWDESARAAITKFEALYASYESSTLPSPFPGPRPKLAFVSPLPLERSGISDYSAELLPELARFYDIEVVVDQVCVGDAWVNANCPVRDAQWLRKNAHRMDRVLYQMGNSPFHQHMLALLEDVPGTVVLHDFFLSGLRAYMEATGTVQNGWAHALYHAHGYSAVRGRYYSDDTADVKFKYPVNLDILQRAQGVIVHSDYSRKLAEDWFGVNFAADWRVIPLLRTPYAYSDRAQARAALGLSMDDFVVCSFGFLDSSKLNHCLLRAWLRSCLAQNARCVLVFVGENHGGEYGTQLLETIRASGLEERIRITGWADMPVFRNYLAAADVAVQLRTLSRGETSAAVLDCMNNGIPTIVNANGSFAELPTDAVWMLPDEFEDYRLIEALETLWQDDQRRNDLGGRAREVIRTRHAPATCASQYFGAIEHFHKVSATNQSALANAIAELDVQTSSQNNLISLAQAIAQTLPEKKPTRTLYIDLSATRRTNLKTGIERVARALTLALLDAPPEGYRIEPVHLSDQGGVWHYRHARRYTLQLLNCPDDVLDDDPAHLVCGDVVLGLDISGDMLVQATNAGLFKRLRNEGVRIHFIVYDLLPLAMPDMFPPNVSESHAQWLAAVAQGDSAVCITKTVSDDLREWCDINILPRMRQFDVSWFHLGADVESSAPSRGLASDAEQFLAQCAARPTFLMVGTIEPRKGYLSAMDAFTELWRGGVDVNLVIVGGEGWVGISNDMRRTIPLTIERLRHHPELGKRLFWLEGISDEYLEKVYAASTCLIAASEGEGFGLPLIEAAQHKIPIIARDIPAFREVAGIHAYYFGGTAAEDLVAAIKEWLGLYQAGLHPTSGNMPWLTWKESAEQLKGIILKGQLAQPAIVDHRSPHDPHPISTADVILT